MCSACFCIFPRSKDRQPMCYMCFCVFLTKLSNLDTAKPPRVSCVFVFFFLSTFNLDQYLTWANAPCVLFVFVFFAQVAGHITNVFMCFNFWLRSTGAEMEFNDEPDCKDDKTD